MDVVVKNGNISRVCHPLDGRLETVQQSQTRWDGRHHRFDYQLFINY